MAPGSATGVEGSGGVDTKGRQRRTILLAAAALIAGVELSVAATTIGDYARLGYRSATTPNPLVREADLDPLASFVPTDALVRAAAAIPAGATYTVVVGDDPPVERPAEVRVAFRFWLQPRRFTRGVEGAEWVIAYHRSSERLGVRYSSETGLAPGVNVVRVRR
jgi:hypothetical protein